MTKEVWGGRFKKDLDPEIKEFTSSIAYDKKLASYDIKGSIAHAKMLGKCKIISGSESKKIVKGLLKIDKKIKKNIKNSFCCPFFWILQEFKKVSFHGNPIQS